MVAPTAPLWTRRPTRFSGRSPRQARWLLALLGVLLLASLTALVTPGPPPLSVDGTAVANDRADELLYEAIVDDLRHGAEYYTTAANALRRGGYPLRPFVTFRLPTLAVVQSWMSPVAAALLLYTLALVTLWAWWKRLGDAFGHFRPRIIASLLVAAGMASAVRGELAAFHDIWAGLLIALSLAARRPGHWGTAVAIGLSAMLIRETVALYVAIMAVVALVEGERREAIGWLAAIGILVIAVALHAQAVAGVVRPLDQPSPGWTGMLGFGFGIKAMVLTTAVALLPAALGALLAGLSIAGWSAWRDPLATRALGTLVGYVLLLSLFGRTDTFYWAFLVAPIAFVGLTFVPDMVRDLLLAALDRRRITVTRITR